MNFVYHFQNSHYSTFSQRKIQNCSFFRIAKPRFSLVPSFIHTRYIIPISYLFLFFKSLLVTPTENRHSRPVFVPGRFNIFLQLHEIFTGVHQSQQNSNLPLIFLFFFCRPEAVTRGGFIFIIIIILNLA